MAESGVNTLSDAGMASIADEAGMDHVDEPGLCVNVFGMPVMIETGKMESGSSVGAVFVMLGIGGATLGTGGKGGNSFGTGGMSAPFRITPDVQLDEPDSESEPSTTDGSPVLALCSPLFACSCNGVAGRGIIALGKGGMFSNTPVPAVDGRRIGVVVTIGLGGNKGVLGIFGEEGAVEPVACVCVWETESRRFSFERKLSQPPPELLSSLCVSFG